MFRSPLPRYVKPLSVCADCFTDWRCGWSCHCMPLRADGATLPAALWVFSAFAWTEELEVSPGKVWLR